MEFLALILHNWLRVEDRLPIGSLGAVSLLPINCVQVRLQRWLYKRLTLDYILEPKKISDEYCKRWSRGYHVANFRVSSKSLLRGLGSLNVLRD